ncbi:MAG TPA: hypothetical protein VFD43_10325, partial [Planctomycetota bacterium]|nr:hypothetical protein [Planctomycetota bacterium]
MFAEAVVEAVLFTGEPARRAIPGIRSAYRKIAGAASDGPHAPGRYTPALSGATARPLDPAAGVT